MRARIEIYSIAGRLVKVLMDGEKEAGRYAVEWDGTDQEHRAVASGVYIYSLSNGILKQTRTMTYLK